jgi:radical SAM protein with 4Fe4S-binding SPASM domain
MMEIDWRKNYLRLHDQAALKRLETPYLYHLGRDELYEIDERAEAFLLHCNGTAKGEELTTEAEFVEYCLEEQLLTAHPKPHPRDLFIETGAIPSLRYLELHLTHQCNLRCRHCYLGGSQPAELSLADALNITRQFSANGGLRLLISGGEPMLYEEIQAYLEESAVLTVRRVLFTNGTLINKNNIVWLNVDEIQFSLDGWQNGHERLRGKGTFARTLHGIETAVTAGIPVSISSMVHRGNLDEFDRMKAFMGEIGAVEWGIDIPSVSGSMEIHSNLRVDFKTAAPFLEYAFGGGYHGSSDGFACGRHLLAVMPNGQAVKCGFYKNTSLGDARKSLRKCWEKVEHIPLNQLECKGCEVLDDCRGGCRFRAPRPLAPDPAMCCFYGISA